MATYASSSQPKQEVRGKCTKIGREDSLRNNAKNRLHFSMDGQKHRPIRYSLNANPSVPGGPKTLSGLVWLGLWLRAKMQLGNPAPQLKAQVLSDLMALDRQRASDATAESSQ